MKYTQRDYIKGFILDLIESQLFADVDLVVSEWNRYIDSLPLRSNSDGFHIYHNVDAELDKVLKSPSIALCAMHRGDYFYEDAYFIYDDANMELTSFDTDSVGAYIDPDILTDYLMKNGSEDFLVGDNGTNLYYDFIEFVHERFTNREFTDKDDDLILDSGYDLLLSDWSIIADDVFSRLA